MPPAFKSRPQWIYRSYALHTGRSFSHKLLARYSGPWPAIAVWTGPVGCVRTHQPPTASPWAYTGSTPLRAAAGSRQPSREAAAAQPKEGEGVPGAGSSGGEAMWEAPKGEAMWGVAVEGSGSGQARGAQALKQQRRIDRTQDPSCTLCPNAHEHCIRGSPPHTCSSRLAPRSVHTLQPSACIKPSSPCLINTKYKYILCAAPPAAPGWPPGTCAWCAGRQASLGTPRRRWARRWSSPAAGGGGGWRNDKIYNI